MQKANKTRPNEQSVANYIAAIADSQQRNDAAKLVEIMQESTDQAPVMWGTSIVGFGNYHYVYESGREGDTPVVSFAARKNALTLYGILHYEQNQNNLKLIDKLGPHTSGKGCLYIKSLSDINIEILKAMIKNAYIERPKNS